MTHEQKQKMTTEEMIKRLHEIWNELDELQETKLAQDTSEQCEEEEDGLLWYIGEAMGHIDNAIDCVEE